MARPKILSQWCSLVLSTMLLSGGTALGADPQPLNQGTPDLQQMQLQKEIRDRVEEEVDLAFRRSTTFLNVFIIVLTLFPTTAAIAVWIFLGKLARQTVISQQEIDSIRYDTISQLKRIIGESQMILEALREESKIAEQQTQLLHSEMEQSPPHPGENNSQNNSTDGRINHNAILAADYSKQGDNFFFEGRYEEAINAYNESIRLEPNGADVWNNRGVVLTRLQRYDPAIASYDRALQILPNYGDAWNNRGVTLLELQRYEDAIDSYDHAIQVKPDYADAWNNRGVAFARLQNFEEAILSYNEALRIKNDYLDAWNNRGHALAKLQKLDAAIDCYNQAVKIRPDFHRAWYNKARCYALQGKIEFAIESLEHAINLNPTQCVELAKNDPDFDRLRQHDVFKKLIGETHNLSSQRKSA